MARSERDAGAALHGRRDEHREHARDQHRDARYEHRLVWRRQVKAITDTDSREPPSSDGGAAAGQLRCRSSGVGQGRSARGLRAMPDSVRGEAPFLRLRGGMGAILSKSAVPPRRLGRPWSLWRRDGVSAYWVDVRRGGRWPVMRVRELRPRRRQRVDRLAASAAVAGLVAGLVARGGRGSRPKVVIDLRVVVTVDLTESIDSPGHGPASKHAGGGHRPGTGDAGQRHRNARGRPPGAFRPPRHLRLVTPSGNDPSGNDPSGNDPSGAGNPAEGPGKPRREVTDLQWRRGRRWRR
jgi:hypothetical protein